MGQTQRFMQSTFHRGSVSDKYMGQIESPIRARGVSELINMCVTPQGNLARMRGTKELGVVSGADRMETFGYDRLFFSINSDTVRVAEPTSTALGSTYIPTDTGAGFSTLLNPGYQAIEVRAQAGSWPYSGLKNGLLLIQDGGTEPPHFVYYSSGWKIEEMAIDNLTVTAYPTCGAIHEQRLIYGNVNTEGSILGSRTGESTNFNIGSLDDDAYQFEPTGLSNEEIVWLQSHNDKIYFGTKTAEYVMSGGGAPITPTNVRIRKISDHGSVSNRPNRVIVAGNTLMHITADGGGLQTIEYDDNRQSYNTTRITDLFDHLITGTIDEAHYWPGRVPMILLLCDRRIIAVTWSPATDVVGAQVWEVGGAVRSLAVNRKSRRAYVMFYGGAVHELLPPIPEVTDGAAAAHWYVTEGKAVDVNGTSVDATHLNDGAEAQVYGAMSGYLGQHTVDGTEIILPESITESVVLGRPMPARVTTNRLSTGDKIRIHKTRLGVSASEGAKVGPHYTQLSDVEWFGLSDDPTGEHPEYTGWKTKRFDGQDDTDGYISVQAEGMYHLNITSIQADYEVWEET